MSNRFSEVSLKQVIHQRMHISLLRHLKIQDVCPLFTHFMHTIRQEG